MDSSIDKSNPVKRLFFKSYLQMIDNSIGSIMFKNFYISVGNHESDALSDGRNSCAFYVSCILVIFSKISRFHGTVIGLVKDLEDAGWYRVTPSSVKAGDIVLYSAKKFDDGIHMHIGFYIGDNSVVSTSEKSQKVIKHELNFDHSRPVESIFRYKKWD